jgi:hypothetical protein
MADLMGSLKKKIPAIFESEEFQSARNEIINRHMGAQKPFSRILNSGDF